jgi:CubicO group peptidase (beta-lactamase class C family)
MRRFVTALALVLAFTTGGFGAEAKGRTTAPSAALPAGFDVYVAQVMKAFEVPGLAVAVVKDGSVLLARGYGVRRLGEATPVDESTLFGIASNTKVFTAIALALLVEEGKIEWDAPVARYLPAFQMWDPWVTREITVRDLLVHRSGLGLGAGDLLWWPPSTYDRPEIMRRLRYIKPATSFRSAYAYDNVLYLVAGQLIEAVSGRSWEDFVTARILRRVGMDGSNVSHSGAAAGGNVATPHARVDGVVRAVAPFASDNTNPAGGINSSATDMARWLSVLLSRGRLADGARLYSEDTARALETIVTPIPLSPLPPDAPTVLAAVRPQFLGYGLGLGIADYRGHKVVRHSGGLPGYVSYVVRVPDAGLGVAVLTNQESELAYTALAYRLLDHFLGAPPTDWLAAWQKVQAWQQAGVDKAVRETAARRDTSSKPSLPLTGYAGTYRDDWYGDVTVALEDGRLVVRFSHTPSLVGDLEHWQHDTFVARWRDRELRADAFISFALDADGRVEQAKMRAVSPETDFSFDFQDLLLRPVPAAP